MSKWYQSVPKATPQAAAGRRMRSDQLCRELALGSIRLCLDRQPISKENVKRVRPAIAAAYTQRYDVIMSYLGQGRSHDGLGLHRPSRGVPFPVCRENAGLALARAEALGLSPDAVAGLVGFAGDGDALVAACEALPPYESEAVRAAVAVLRAPDTAQERATADDQEEDEEEAETPAQTPDLDALVAGCAE